MYIEVTSGEKYEKIVLTQQEYDSTIRRISVGILSMPKVRYLQPV